MERHDNTLRVMLDSIVEVMEDLVTRVKVHELPDNCIVHIETSDYISQEKASRLIASLGKAYDGKGIEFLIAKKGNLNFREKGITRMSKNIIPQNCGNCEHWNKNKNCKCPILFPDANIYSSISEGYKTKMSASDGKLCPTHKRKGEEHEQIKDFRDLHGGGKPVQSELYERGKNKTSHKNSLPAQVSKKVATITLSP